MKTAGGPRLGDCHRTSARHADAPSAHVVDGKGDLLGLIRAPEPAARGGTADLAEAGPGDFIYVPPFVPHQEINASPTETLECVLCRSDGQAVAINLDIEPVEKPESVLWVDPVHRDPAEKK